MARKRGKRKCREGSATKISRTMFGGGSINLSENIKHIDLVMNLLMCKCNHCRLLRRIFKKRGITVCGGSA